MISGLFSLVSDQSLNHPLRSIVAAFFLVPVLYLLGNEVVRRKARLPAFTGPPGLPVVGNIPDIKYNAAEKYREWSRTYGDVYQIQLGNIPVIVVNSAQAARTIFGQFSQALSSRPVFYTFHKVGHLRRIKVWSPADKLKGSLEYGGHNYWHFSVQ